MAKENLSTEFFRINYMGNMGVYFVVNKLHGNHVVYTQKKAGQKLISPAFKVSKKL